MNLKPMHGLTVLNSRATHQALSFTEKLHAVGATVVEHPAIEIGPCSDPADLLNIETILSDIQQFETFVFVSSNGVRYFFDSLQSLGLELSESQMREAVAIGPSTAAFALGFGVHCETPKVANSESLASFLINHRLDDRMLILRANRGSAVLAERLKSANAQFKELVVYQSCDVVTLEPEIESMLLAGEVDWLPLASSASARNMLGLIKPIWGRLTKRPQIASISPTTSEAIRSSGFEPDVEAESFDLGGLIKAMIE